MKPKIIDRMDYILNLCRGKRVLHLGCANFPFTRQELDNGTLVHAEIEKVAADLYGIDLSDEAIQLLKMHGYQNLAAANIEELEYKNPFGEVDFDIVLAGEIIEHLSNPGAFLDGTKTLLKRPSARLVLTTVNAYCAHRFAFTLLTGREAVHFDHVYYFSHSTLTELLTRHGYEVEEFSFYWAPYVKKVNRPRRRLLCWFDRFVSAFCPMLGDGVMATCKLRVP